MSNKKTNSNKEQTPPRKDGIRETVESIVIAFVFAFLFRTFEAEAFVIPTGSMAPTLFGRHKDVDCESCGFHFHVGASAEMTRGSQQYDFRDRLTTAYCPNCRYKNNIKDLHAFTGDRILVNKFPYEIGDPKRWDVPVFKYPEDPGTNYIKRLVGMPGETIRIRQGNVYAKKEDKKGWQILRKDDPHKQRAIQILVFNNDHRPVKLHEKGLPECWASVSKSDAEGNIAGWSEESNGWKSNDQKSAFRLNAQQTEEGHSHWLRYRHYVPQTSDWSQSEEQGFEEAEYLPRLITDYCAYNAFQPSNGHHSPVDEGIYWNGELTIDATFQISKVETNGELLLELNQGARKYRCRFHLETGETTLSYETGLSRDEEDEKVLATTITAVKGAGTYQVSFANVDNRLCLWVNDSLVDFGTKKGEYVPYGGHNEVQSPEDGDLTPVGIAAKGLDISASHLIIHRDIYYRADYLHPRTQFERHDGNRVHVHEYGRFGSALIEKQTDPESYGNEYNQYALWNDQTADISPNSYDLVLDKGEYLMLGDNSPASSDSRAWTNLRHAKHRYAVPREAFVGKAFYIYWPHGIPFGNGGKGYALFEYPKGAPDEKPYPSTSIPFYPNFSRMKRIR